MMILKNLKKLNIYVVIVGENNLFRIHKFKEAIDLCKISPKKIEGSMHTKRIIPCPRCKGRKSC